MDHFVYGTFKLNILRPIFKTTFNIIPEQFNILNHLAYMIPPSPTKDYILNLLACYFTILNGLIEKKTGPPTFELKSLNHLEAQNKMLKATLAENEIQIASLKKELENFENIDKKVS